MSLPHQPSAGRPASRRRMNVSNEDFFGPQPTPTAELPDSDGVLRFLAVAMVEIDEGARDLEQLGHIVDDRVYRFLRGRLVFQRRVHALERGPRMRPKVAVGRIHSRSPRDGVLEAVVMVTYGKLTRAVVVRLEGWDNRWRATDLHIL